MNLNQYIAQKRVCFNQSPLNKLDVLAFVWLSYFDMRELKPRMPLPIKSLVGDSYTSTLEKRHESFIPKTTATLFRSMMSSPRYRDATIVDYEHANDPNSDVQFGALAILAGNHLIIVFEGTDLSYVGWKEDCVMSYSDSIASYPLANAFVKRVMDLYSEPVILAGHSKGGNIAAYMLASMEDDSRVEDTYSFEGPGFHSKKIFSKHPERETKLHKFIPYSSVVGVLLCNESNAMIVKSRSVGVLQHNTFKWLISGDDFVYTDKRSLSSQYIDEAVNGWLATLSEDERKRFTSLLFNTLSSSKSKDFKNLLKNVFREMPALSTAYKQMGNEDKTFFQNTIKSLFATARNTLLSKTVNPIKRLISPKNASKQKLIRGPKE